MIRIWCLVIGCFILFGCKKENQRSIEAIYTMINNAPDSAYKLLQQQNIDQFSKQEEKALFALSYVEVLSKNMISLDSDFLLKIAYNHYSQTDDYNKFAKINFYFGKYFSRKDSVGKSTEYLIRADQYAIKSGDKKLLGLIYNELGNLYVKQYKFDNALFYYRNSKSAFLDASDTINYNYLDASIARCFTCMNQQDSSIYYLNKSRKIAEESGETNYLNYLNKLLFPLYVQKSEVSKAKKLLKRIYANNQDKEYYYFGMSDCLYNEQENDSAKLYLTLLLNDTSINLSLKSEISLFIRLRRLAAIEKDYKNAYQYALKIEDLNDSLKRMIEQENILKLEQMYRNEQLKNQSYQLDIKNNRKTIAIRTLFMTIFIIILTGLLIYHYLRKLLKQKQEQNVDYVSMIEALKEEQKQAKNAFLIALNEKNDRESKLKQALSRRLDIIKKLTELSYRYNNSNFDNIFCNKVKELMKVNTLTQDTLSDLIEVVNINYGGIVDYLKQNYQLSNEDLTLCCFIISGFSFQEMSILYNITVKSLYMRCCRLGKKMALEQPLATFLKTRISLLNKTK